MAGLDGFGKRCLVDQTATGAVDDTNARLRLRESFLVEDATRLVRHRHMQRDEIGAGEQIVQLDLLHTHFLGTFLGQERVIGNDVHAQAMARAQTMEPILPAPMTPSVLPVISTPMNFDFSHLPACVEASAQEADGPRRTSAR